MDKPKITINGKEIEMQTKARLWSVVMKFEDERGEFSVADAVEKYCEIIAVAFGVTTEEILDNLDIADVAPTYFKIYNAVAELLTKKRTGRNLNLTAYEGVLSCYLFAMREFNSSYAEVDNMDLETLLDLICVYDKINDTETSKNKKGHTYKVLD